MVKKSLSFEDGLARLEAIADEMEKNELPLDKLMKLYEEGMKLSAELEQKLTDAQGRMQEVKAAADGTPQCVPMELAHQETLLDGTEAGGTL